MKHFPTWIASGAAALFAAAALGQASGAPGPSAEHKRLGYFVGAWSVSGEMKPGVMGPGGKFSGTETCEWFQGGFAVVCRSEGEGPMGPTQGLSIMSYSPEERVYTYYGTDNSGTAMTSVPRGTVQEKTWSFTDETVMGGAKVKSRVTIDAVSPSKYRFTMDIEGPEGKWIRLFESTATKTGSAEV